MGSQTTSSGMRSDPVLELARRGAVQLAVGGGVILSGHAQSLVERRPSRRSHVRAVVLCDGGMATFEVFDDGPPLPDDEREWIFMPYERVGSGGVVESVGLGLHVARVLARLMGGDLTYDHDGRESVFRLELATIAEPSKELDGAAAM